MTAKTPMGLSARTLLQPCHFVHGSTRLTPAGLAFCEHIDHDDRQCACLEIGEEFEDAELTLRLVAAKRPAARLELHPLQPTAPELLNIFKCAQEEAMPGEAIAVGHGMSVPYDLQWSLRHDGGEVYEGQALTLVAFDAVQPVGYAGLKVTLHHDGKRKDIFLCFIAELTYVIPQRRGLGYGLDLSVASGWICRDILEAAYRAAPAGETIQTCLNADYVSKGGEAFARHLHVSLEFAVDLLRDTGNRRSVRLERVELDAGY